MISARRLAIALFAALLLTSCAAHSVRIADIKDRPGKYDEKTISVSGVVTSSWGIPLVPYQFYNVSDGTGEISVLSRAGRAPSKGAHVKVEGRDQRSCLVRQPLDRPAPGRTRPSRR